MILRLAALVSVFVAMAIGFSCVPSKTQESGHAMVMGGGKTILVGGDGGMMQGEKNLPTPVITLLSFQAMDDGKAVSGRFECLALGPPDPKSFQGGSGDFSVNIMYVTGNVTGLKIDGSRAVLTGKSLITGVGAGIDLDFTFETETGGPGSFMTLTTQNSDPNGMPLVFKEQMIEGEVNFGR